MSSTLIRRAFFPRATNHLLLSRNSCSTHTLSPPPSEETTVTTAVSILTHHRSKSRWSALLSLFPHGIPPPKISQILLQIRNNPHLALRFFHFTTRHFQSLSPSLHSYATIIHILARARQKSRAQTLIRDAIRVSGDLSPGQNGQSCQLLKVLVETYRVCDSAPFVFDLLIKSLLDMNKLDPCIDIVRMLKSRGNLINVSTCNALIAAASKRKGCFFGYDLFKEVCDEGVTGIGSCTVVPNVHTFNELMLSFYRNGVLDMVEEVWIEMSKWKCSADCYSYSILMEAYCENDDIEKAKNVWNDMRLKGLVPDIVAYNTLIGGYCKGGVVEKGEELYREMGLCGVEGTCVTYQHLVNGYCLVGDADSTMLLCKDMRSKGYCPDSSTADAVVCVLCDKKRVVEALEFFKDVMDNAVFTVRETCYEVLIEGLCDEGNMEDALNLQAQMVGKGFRPTADIYAAFIHGYMKQGKTDLAEKLRREMITT